MKGFGIYVKNNLLEPKHVQAMGAAVWLYMWLLDAITSVNEEGTGKILGGKPITYPEVQAHLGITHTTYIRYLDALRNNGYINTLRTPTGLVITLNKAEKIFGNQRSPKTDFSKSDVSKSDFGSPNTDRDVPKTDFQIRQDNDSTIDNTNNTKVLDPTGLGPPPSYGKPEINELFTEWSKQCGYDIESKVKANRAAASNLLKKHGHDKLIRLISGVSMAQSDPYAPRIADFCALQSKQSELIAWGKTKMHDYAGPLKFGSSK